MISFGGFPLPQCSTAPCIRVLQVLLVPTRTSRVQVSSCHKRAKQFGFCAFLGQKRTGFWVYAFKSGRKGGNDLLEKDGVDDDFVEEVDEEDGDVFVPLRNMKKWLEDKPLGFGEGKVYDTSIEDKLMEEIELSRQAQLANINKLRNNPESPNSKKEQLQKQKASADIQNGICVRLSHLPKKKNIHRDLQLAFKGVPGIVNIIPAVSGNKKTRDPICKGLAFVDFKSDNEANRFVQMFSGQCIAFGKTQKQIKCEITNPRSSNPPVEESIDVIKRDPQLTPRLEGNQDSSDFDASDPSLESWKETTCDEFESNDGEQTQQEDGGENLETVNSSEPSAGDNTTKQRRKPAGTRSLSPEQKGHRTGKKLAAKRKVKLPKQITLGSANRLKIREKAVLTGVFSKYGVNHRLAEIGESQGIR